MKIYLDTADVAEVQKYFATGLIDGVTTNPTLIRKSGRKPQDVYRELKLMGVRDISMEIVGDAPVPTAHCDTAAIIAHIQQLMHSDAGAQPPPYTSLDGDRNYEACLAMARYSKSRGRHLMIVGSCGDDLVCDIADLILWFAGAHAGVQGETVWPPLPHGADTEQRGYTNALHCVGAQGDINDFNSQCPGGGVEHP